MTRSRTALSALFLLCAAPLGAQVYATMPPGFLTAEGPGVSGFGFGSYAEARYVLMDGTWTGTPLAVQGLSLRPDYRSHNPRDSQGRSWSSVSIKLYEGDHDGHGAKAATQTFASIAQTTPSTAFAGKLVFPALSGVPATRPSAFSVQIPFAIHWIYSGKQDLCFDFRFSGGTLHNGASWSGTFGYGYLLDSPGGNGGVATAPTQTYGKLGQGQGCIDQGGSVQTGAYTRSVLTTYNQQYSYKPYRGTIRVGLASYFTAPKQPVILAITNQAHPGITHPAVACNQLHFDPSKTWGTFVPQASSSLGSTSSLLVAAPYASKLVGLKLFTQAGWADSQTGQFKLSAGSLASVPAMPPPSFKRRACIATKAAALSGTLSTEPGAMPLLRLTR